MTGGDSRTLAIARLQRQQEVSQEEVSMRKNYSAIDMETPPSTWSQMIQRNHSSVELSSPKARVNGNGLRLFTRDLVANDQQSLYNFSPPKSGSVSAGVFEASTEVDSPGAPMLRYRPAHHTPHHRKVRKRLMNKSGITNITKENVAKKKQRFLKDFFTTLVDIQWRYNLLIFAMGFILSWLGFAVIWWLIAFSHGDFQEEHIKNTDWKPCVLQLTTFTAAFLFSIETQHTIGYGVRTTTEECPEAIFIMCIQSITGVMIQAFMVGVVFAKLSRPKSRAKTLMFSRNATICMRDGKLLLMIRVGDMRKSHIIEAHISAMLFRRKVTLEGEVIPFHHTKIKVSYDSGDENILFMWPIVIVHEIDEDSPFYQMSAEDLLHNRFELIVILEGIVESTSSNTQARASYLPNEILWGHRFEQMVSFKKDTGEYKIDYGLFNSTYEVDTPLCSAAELDEYVRNGGRFPSVSLPPSRGPCLVQLRESSITESAEITERVAQDSNPQGESSDITDVTTSSKDSSHS